MKNICDFDSFKRNKKEKDLLRLISEKENGKDLKVVQKQIESWPIMLIEAAILSLKKK